MNCIRFAKKKDQDELRPSTNMLARPSNPNHAEASKSLTDSFYAEEFGEGTTPGQIFADGVIKFQ